MDCRGTDQSYSKTLHALGSNYADYCILVMSAKEWLTPITKEHLLMAITMKLPIIIVLTKTDLVDKKNVNLNLSKMKAML